MLNANGPGFAGLYAGDTVRFVSNQYGIGGDREVNATVLPYLVFEDHVQVKHTPFGFGVDARNFVRLVRRGKRHIAADKALRDYWAQGGTPHTRSQGAA